MGILILGVLIYLAAIHKKPLLFRIGRATLIPVVVAALFGLFTGAHIGLVVMLYCGMTMHIPIIVSLWTYVMLTEIVAKKFRVPARDYLIFVSLLLISTTLIYFWESLPTPPCDLSM